MKISDLQGKKITVMGLGTLGGGIGTVKFLVKNKANVLVTDLKSRSELKESLKRLKSCPVHYVLGKHRLQDFSGADLIIKNPAVSRNSRYLKTARKKGVPIESDASLFFRLCTAPIIGVTGTKGKTTTVSLIKKLLDRKSIDVVLVGHNRISVLDRLSKIRKKSIVLFELSSWRLEELGKIRRSPWISVITNIFPDHLNTYKGIKEYQEAKKNVFRFQSKDDFVILNKNNPITRKMGKEVISQRYWFSTKYFLEQNGCFIKNKKIFFRKKGKETLIMDTRQFKLLGNHNKENILSAITVAKILKVSTKDIKYVLSHFKGIPDRLDLVRTWKGIKFYNDTTATIPEATIAAINSFAKRVVLIAGGQDKRLNYSDFAKVAKKQVGHLALLPGSASQKLSKHLANYKFSVSRHNSLPSAFKKAVQVARKGDIIIFSPGAASFNLFLNEFDRGDQFNKLVQKLP